MQISGIISLAARTDPRPTDPARANL